MTTIRRIAPWALAATLVASLAVLAWAARPAAASQLDLTRVLERNAAARGGLEGWRKVRTMAWSGHVEGADGRQLPFLLGQKRPNLTRFEIVTDGQRSVRIFDGEKGWKLRASPSERREPQPYDDDEERAARDAPVIDGPVLDAASKGVQLALDGTDEVEGRPAYRLRAKLPSGTIQHVWIDAQTFLDVKYDRPARDAAGRLTTVPVYLRDYRPVEGLQLPFTVETGAPGVNRSDRLVIERVALNPTLPDGMFARPDLRRSRRGATVDTRSPPPVPRPQSSR